jgi:CO dehydrogenase maturation factor
MKIAFVGKGGSGKSTLSALYISHLMQHGRNVLAIDADLNMNLSNQLGVEANPLHLMARPDVADHVRTVLKGSNPRVQDISKFLPTTPPGQGSHIVRDLDDQLVQQFSTRVADNCRLMTVGSYDAEGIGQTCYHTHLFVAENLLSHVDASSMDVVCDMVAGTDAFAYSLHLQFDAIVLIAEPTPESAEVCALYMDLARKAGIDGLVHLVANKVEDGDDLEFIAQAVGRTPVGSVPLMPSLKKARQQNRPVNTDMIDFNMTYVMTTITEKAEQPAISEAVRMNKLLALHETLNAKKWVQLGYGDVMGQIDPDYKLGDAA